MEQHEVLMRGLGQVKEVLNGADSLPQSSNRLQDSSLVHAT